MLLCYAYRQLPTGDITVGLCVVADKPDDFSLPIPVESLVVTDSAVVRVGPQEALKVARDPSGGIICSPVVPSRLCLTPDVLDRPGIQVRAVKITRDQSGRYTVFFRQEKDGPDDWRQWNPNEAVG